MPAQGHSDGLYMVRRPADKLGWHFGIAVIGNRFSLRNARPGHPMVFHQRPPRIALDRLEDTGPWFEVQRITDEWSAIQRINLAYQNPTYNLFGNNCEHFARYVATGKRESKQLQTVVLVVSLAALIIYVSRAADRRS